MKFFKRKKIITRDDNEPYLVRWNLFECRFFSIKIHRILKSDDNCLHDHPWAFLSIILKGGYVEDRVVKWHFTQHNEVVDEKTAVFYDESIDEWGERKKKLYGAGSILFRRAKSVHRLEVYQPTTTLVITFRKIREWGFFGKRGWIPWYKYSNKNHCEQ